MYLSIVIPVFNRQHSLNALLKEISFQILSNNLENSIEVLVVDDCSIPPIFLPKEIVEVKVKTNLENAGSSISRRKGFESSKGDFVHFHDSDDLISKNWMKELFAEITDNSNVDILLTGRIDQDNNKETYLFQKYFHNLVSNSNKVESRLIYRNCMGPLGGVTFSRRILEEIEFKRLASCQDWQMYIDAIKHAKVLISRPDIHFIFNKTGDDRISHNPRKKILGHLQLAKITGKKSVFGRSIRLFYLYTCKQHIYNKGGLILKFYKKNRIKIFITFLIISVYWRIT